MTIVKSEYEGIFYPSGSVANSAGRSGKVNLDQEPTGTIPRRHFGDGIILLCVRWYLRYSLSYRDLEEITAERGLSVDHVTIRLGPAFRAHSESTAPPALQQF
jgi:hypothetical protein